MSKKLLIALALLPCLASAQKNVNPLVVVSNKPLAVNKIDSAIVVDAVAQVIKTSDAHLAAMGKLHTGQYTKANTLLAYDNLVAPIYNLIFKLSLINNTFANDAARNAAQVQQDKLISYNTNLYLDERLYRPLKGFSLSPAAKNLRPAERKLLQETIDYCEVNGMKLDAAHRELLKKINDKITSFGEQFDNNVAANKDSVVFTADQLKGVPGNILKKWQRPGGRYVVRVNSPNTTDMLKYAGDEATRHAYYLVSGNKAYPANVKPLDSMLYYRNESAKIIGYRSYAESIVSLAMAKSPKNVWHFLDDLRDKVSDNAQADYDELKSLKRKLEPDATDVINHWDLSYYTNKLLDSKYRLDDNEVKQYFEMDNTVKGMLALYEKILGVTLRETRGVPVWDAKVKSYELLLNGKKMGTFYMDLYPRPNKYNHFETQSIGLYQRLPNGKEILPVGSLICNFPESTPGSPSLLTHRQVITLFHEFGHLVHLMLAHPALSSQGPFFVKGDFVEAPSQFLENFCWSYDCLKLFAHHYKTGKVLPPELFAKMKNTELVGAASGCLGQVYQSMLDFTFEDKYPETQRKGVDSVDHELYLMTKKPYPAGTHWYYAFTHLNDYGANYYGYLWSRVYAKDMFSVFAKNGALNPVMGARYRKLILEKGSTEDEMVMLRNFLGREPNSKAFLASFGLKQ